ncbi:unnamed protein product [Polarella glacialis]|uniref:Uncharacterized protein n=1 Tax=Polarella glacialis TaxID=89957 RepID=A0A813FST1_POLGL|nr:unnamed protein product [Polarella glacialis]
MSMCGRMLRYIVTCMVQLPSRCCSLSAVPAAMALFWGAPCYLGATTSTSSKRCSKVYFSIREHPQCGLSALTCRLPMRLPSWQPSSPCQAVIPKCQRLHGSLKRSGAKLLTDGARADHFVRGALRQAPAFPDEFEPGAEGICADCKSRMIWRFSIPNFFKPLEDHESTGGQSQLMSLCTLPGVRCPA